MSIIHNETKGNKQCTTSDCLGEVTATGLTKFFDGLMAVDHINLEVPSGSIFGLLGPNGAGKSTTLRLLCTLLTSTEGEAVVGSYSVHENPLKVREITGILPEEGNHTLYSSMTTYENLNYFARLYGVSKEEIPERIEELLVFMDLWERKDDPAGELSSGNRQRLALCRALLHKPRILLLDEPTSALDPVASKKVRELILSLSSKYKHTFFINSHNLAEIQKMCDRIAIIDNGKILLVGETEELRKKIQAVQEFRIRVVGDVIKAEHVIRSSGFIESVTPDTDSLLVSVKNPLENNSNIMRSLLDAGIKIVEFVEEEATLEDLYLTVIKGGLE